MDNLKAPVPTSPEPGDIDIFLFSNGEALAPPRKYHLTAHELDLWNSTLNGLARAHYGYMHSSLDLYTIDGKKVENPLELANNSAYVAVETKDTFLPGGYDQYLMRASKSWIKRYGSISSNTTSKEKLTAGTALPSEKPTNNTKLEKVTEVQEKKMVEENIEVIETPLKNTELKDPNENSEMTKLPANNDLHKPQKPGDKKKPTPRSSILRKNITNVHPNGKNYINAKEKPPTPSPLKKRPGSPVKNTHNKVTPPRKESLIKALYPPGKPKHNSSQMVNKNNALLRLDVGPEFMFPAQLSNKPETQIQSESIGNGIRKVEQGVPQITKNEQYYESINQIISPRDDILKQEISHREFLGNENEKKVTDTLETIRQNVDGYCDLTRNKKLNDVSALTKSFSTEMQHGDVVKLRLSIEVTPGGNEGNEDKSLPVMNNELWSVVIQEKSSQVNMDEIVFQKGTMNSILEELQKNTQDATQKYVVMHCCCNNYFHNTGKLNEDTINNQSGTVKRVVNNKDYVVLLPYIKPDNDVLGCKCDEVPKSHKIMQTSIIFETTEVSKDVCCKQTVDQATDALSITMDVTTFSRRCSRTSICDRACGTSVVLIDDQVLPTPPPSKESRTVPDLCPVCSNTPKTLEVPTNIKIGFPPPSPKENPIVPYECLVCTNKPWGIEMLDKSTQTDSYCFLLEPRRQPDGHYSFHLPPLHMVKSYYY